MKLLEIKEKDRLNNFISGQKHSQFLQSWQWGEFQSGLNGGILRFGVEVDGQLIAAATLVKKNILFGKSYFYCPRGPIMGFQIADLGLQIEEVENFLFSKIKKIVEEEKCLFLRYEPQKINQKSEIRNQKSIDLQPAKTLVLDLSRSDDELMADMHKKTRYNIRLAHKKGVEVIEADSDNFEHFWDLMEKTSGRDGFRIHSKGHYKKLLELDFVRLYLSRYQGVFISAGLFSFFGDTATYMHGASDNHYRNVMSPYLLQWEVLRKAREDGKRYYDFYGIDEKKWPGVTRFKKGFGGFEIKYPGTHDMVFSPLCYNGYKFLRKIRRKIK